MKPAAPREPSPLGLTALFGLLYLAQGICEPTDGLIAQPVNALLKRWGRSPGEIANFAALATIPWAAKPLYGLLSDFVPLAGYHRKTYLIAASGATALCFAALAAFPTPTGSVLLLLALVMPAVLGVAFSDVVIDALMVEKGQPRGLTGRLQSVQWGAIYGATILTGWAGGWLSQHEAERLGFACCAAASIFTLLLTMLAVTEAIAGSPERTAKATWSVLRSASASRTVLAAALFVFLWNFNPFSTTVLYLHMTEHMKLSEEFYGATRSLEALALAVGSLSYATYCRRVPMRYLIHLSIVLGVFSSLAYWMLADRATAGCIVVVTGLATATATMVQLDVAARICPPQIAGTLFALLMGMANLGILLGTWCGGWLYEWARVHYGSQRAFDILVGMGAMATATCWLVAPTLTRSVAAHSSEPA